MKILHQSDYTIKANRSPYLPDKVISEQKVDRGDSEVKKESVSDDSKMDFKTLSNTQQHNLSSNQKKGLNETNSITSEDNKVVDVWQSPGKISQEDKIEIIKTGFQLQAQNKISLKKYYESVTEPNSLFQLKGYSIKHESIRKNKLYQQLKE